MFQQRLKEANVMISQIGYLLLTHHHDDHSGLLHAILKENSAIRVIMSDQCNELIQMGENFVYLVEAYKVDNSKKRMLIFVILFFLLPKKDKK